MPRDWIGTHEYKHGGDLGRWRSSECFHNFTVREVTITCHFVNRLVSNGINWATRKTSQSELSKTFLTSCLHADMWALTS